MYYKVSSNFTNNKILKYPSIHKIEYVVAFLQLNSHIENTFLQIIFSSKN